MTGMTRIQFFRIFVLLSMVVIFIAAVYFASTRGGGNRVVNLPDWDCRTTPEVKSATIQGMLIEYRKANGDTAYLTTTSAVGSFSLSYISKNCPR